MIGWNGRRGVWYARRGKESFESADFKRAALFAAGYGQDWAASLRYVMSEINGADVHREESK